MANFTLQIRFHIGDAEKEFTVTGGDFTFSETIPFNTHNYTSFVDVPYPDTTYTVKVENSSLGGTQTRTITTTAEPQIYEVSFLLLQQADWTTIKRISDRGTAGSIWQIGDEKDIRLTTGETLTLHILDFNHDVQADDTAKKAGITFGLKELMASPRQMNNEASSSYVDTDLHPWLNGTLFNSLPADLRNVIKEVKKPCAALDGVGNALITTRGMKIFPLSGCEAGAGTSDYPYGEGTKYQIFGNDGSRIKRLNNGAGAASDWWTRSPYSYQITGDNYCHIRFDGVAVYTPSGGFISSVTNPLGICFAFCI